MNRLHRLKTIATTLILFVALPVIVLGCPTCTDGLAGDPSRSGLVQGYFWSIVFMMSMPFLILGGISAYFYYEVRRARLRGQQPDTVSNESAAPEAVAQG